MEEVIGTKEAAEILNRVPGSITKYVRQGKLIPHKRIGNRLVFLKSQIEAFELPRQGNPRFNDPAWQKEKK